ncbi:MAG: SatD family protein [Bacteroidales bacterium]|nr:SatD family protein [Bacteroidales bacterium]
MITSILTGDIINSRNSTQTEAWITSLKEILNSYGNAPKSWETYRGDSFQLEVPNPEESLTAALKIKAVIKQHKNLDVRIGIGIGEITYRANKITESNGPAFTNSGDCFESLRLNTLAIKTPWEDINYQINIMISLASLTIDNWTPTKSTNVKASLLFPEKNQKELAILLNKKSQSTISQSLKSAGMDEINQMLAFFRNAIKSKL